MDALEDLAVLSLLRQSLAYFQGQPLGVLSKDFVTLGDRTSHPSLSQTQRNIIRINRFSST